jgi:thiol-disulfide isomerase/thioredoxin
MHDLSGTPWSMDELRGRVVLVNFWATWCGPCRHEIPDLVKIQDRYGEHVQVIGVSLDEGGTEVVSRFADELQMNYPIVMATPEILEQFSGVFALPTTFVIDPDGGIAQKHIGLVSPAVMEQEARVLASLPTDVVVELVEPTVPTHLADAAHATEIPGLDLARLTPEKKEMALKRLNEDSCSCGCGLTLAQCRINDPTCDVSLPLAKVVVEEIAAL